jgi:phage terminase large subunit-like protein
MLASVGITLKSVLVWQALQERNTRWAVVAPTFGDVRDTCAEGPSGLISICNEYGVLETYNRSMGEIVLTNKSKIKIAFNFFYSYCFLN